MMRLAFITLFLGLTTGPHRIEMTLNGPADHVELQLDGATVATIANAPWAATLDFGRQLAPHRLVARAIDAGGHELARAQQMINLPHATSMVEAVLDYDSGGAPVGVTFLWRSLEWPRPRQLSATLDAKPLAIDGHLRARLPQIDLAVPHLIRVRAVSPSGLIAEHDVGFGGGLEGESGSDLTAVAVRVGNPDVDVARAFRRQVIGVENPPGEVVLVRHPIAGEAAVAMHDVRPGRRRRDGSDLAVTFVWPVASHTAQNADLFPWTRTVPFETPANAKRTLTGMSIDDAAHLRFADAVAAGGLEALRNRRPRAVVLILGQDSADESRNRPPEVRAYLRALGVPLHVWTLGHLDDTRGWGAATDISTTAGFEAAYAALLNDIQSQRIVWIHGDELPAAVEVSGPGVENLATP